MGQSVRRKQFFTALTCQSSFFLFWGNQDPKKSFIHGVLIFWIWHLCFVILVGLQGNMTFRKIWSLAQYGWKFSNFIFGSIWHIWWHLDFGGYSHFWEFSYKNTMNFILKNWLCKVYLISAFVERDLLMNCNWPVLNHTGARVSCF